MKKRRVLVWSASPCNSTGLGIVARNVCNSLHASGRYDLEVVVMDGEGDSWHNRRFAYPYPIYFSSDTQNGELLQKKIMEGRLDIFLTMCDLGLDQLNLNRLIALSRSRGNTFQTVFYTPVDSSCEFRENLADLRDFDYPVVYTHFAYDLAVQAFPELKEKLHIISHGCEPGVFYPVPPRDRRVFRNAIGADDDTFVVMNVNRNQPRKDLGRTMKIFQAFQQVHANSKLYLHARERDFGGNLSLQARALGLEGVVLPEMADWPREAMNGVYSGANVVVSTTLGEGWGLTTTEAMTAKIPVIVPRHTANVEIVGEHEERGYLADCGVSEDAWVFNYGWNDYPRPLTSQRSMLEKLERVYADRAGLEYKGETREKIESAYEWAMQHSWAQIGQQWIDLFDRIGSCREIKSMRNEE